MPRASNPPSGLTDTWGRKNRRLADQVCPACGASFSPLRATSTYCSRPCARKKNGGQNAKPESWWTDQKGYIQGRVLIDGKRKHVKKHRLIAEQMIGRPLRPDEDVHHINGDKADNRPEKLMVLPHGEHTTLTHTGRRKARAAIAKATGEPAKGLVGGAG